MRDDQATHVEQSDLRGLGAEVRALKVALSGFEKLMEERKETVNSAFFALEKHLAMAKAATDRDLVAIEKQTTMSFAASEKAITKAENAQEAYNRTHNDLLRKQDLLVSRNEWGGRNAAVDERFLDLRKTLEGQIHSIDTQIAAILKTLSIIEGRSGGVATSGDVVSRSITILIAIAALGVAILAAVIH